MVSVSVLLPVMDETEALRQTVAQLLAENRDAIAEILIIYSPRTTAAALAVAHKLEHDHAGLVLARCQQRPFLGGALRDGFAWARGSHVLMMASDLETDPADVKHLIAASLTGADIVTATRWARGGGFQGYSPLKKELNWVFQMFFKLLYGTRLTDLTYGFRLFKSEWTKRVEWQELRHPFLLETLLKPLRLGAVVVEVPSRWRARNEGESHNTFLQNFAYARMALQIRWRRRQSLWAAAA
ncbi:MAG TPA: glycosyltransferase [Terriglobales bacterium]|nr:glycosyltransferase [Terriglobales bacterium]